MSHPAQLKPQQSALLVVDVQEKLMPKIPNADALIRNTAFLIDAAGLAGVSVLATEQYPKGLGPTVAELAKRLPQRPEKLTFSCCGAPGLLEGLKKDKKQVVLCGIETHVCVLNTALDLLAEGFQVFLCVDALGSRYAIDHDAALRRLDKSGAYLTTVETVGFEWLGGSHHPRFKEYSALVQRRMQ